MDTKTLHTLDYEKILEEAASFCVSEEGRASLLGAQPLTDEKRIAYLKGLGEEWTRCLNAMSAAKLYSWAPVQGAFRTLRVRGRTLPQAALFAIGRFCGSATHVQALISARKAELDLRNLLARTDALPDLSAAEEAVFAVLDADGQLRDLPPLRAIRKKIRTLNAQINGILKRFTSDPKYASALSSSVPALRDGRQLLAVKAAHRSAISGIAHEVSQSGMTVFIEPAAAVECANKVAAAEAELNAEIRRLLFELSETLRPFWSDFDAALAIMTELDYTLAAAKWGAAQNGIFAEDASGAPLTLLQARHPLFGERAVPVDIRFPDSRRVLIISGPNTGGKTAAVKTVALFAMLNQTGLPIPAAEGSRLPVFSALFADIGDTQSLEHALSTFSGHMKNIAYAVSEAQKDSLVILDELGSGTDPEEGAAISLSVLDALIEKNAFVLVTTHLAAIKNYGYASPACVNASVAFNEDARAPAYRLQMGITGESRALDIAQQSGIPPRIVAAARSYIAGDRADVSALIKGLTEKLAAADALRAELEKRERTIAEREARLETRRLALKEAEHELKEERQRDADDFLSNARKDLANLVRRLKEGELSPEKTKAAAQFVIDLGKTAAQNQAALEAEGKELAAAKEQLELRPPAKTEMRAKNAKKKRLKNADALKNAVPLAPPSVRDTTPAALVVGGDALYGKKKRRGTLIRKAEHDCWEVLFGSITMTVNASELIPVKGKARERIPPFSVDFAAALPESRPEFELRVLGFRVDEAIRALERQLDLCTLHNFTNFSIIHGKGEGILQQALTDYLSNCPAVASFAFAPPEDGGSGKTYVTLQAAGGAS